MYKETFGGEDICVILIVVSFHGIYIYGLKLIKLHTLNMYNLLYVSYISIKLLKKTNKIAIMMYIFWQFTKLSVIFRAPE